MSSNSTTSSSTVTAASSTSAVKQPDGADGESLTDSNAFMFGLASLALFLLLVVVYAIYKYRNRDEGTYRIDETKNCGPFAELSMPLNGEAGATAKSAKAKKKKKKKTAGGGPMRNNNPNREWYV